MNAALEFGIAVLGQVTVITLIAALLMAARKLSAATRHAIGVAALVLSLVSPGIVASRPRGAWLSLPAIDSTRQIEMATSMDEPVSRPDERMITAVESRSPSHLADDDEVAPIRVMSPDLEVRTNRPTIEPTSAESWPTTWNERLAVDRATWLRGAAGTVGCLWIVGAMFLASRWLWRSWKVQQLRRGLCEWTISQREGSTLISREHILNDVAAALRIRELPPILASDRVPTPVVLGVWRPVVVIPQALMQSASDQRLRDVLIHECAHIVRRDPAVNAAQRVAGILFWLHPGVHWLNCQIARSREEVCDNFVLREGDPAEYAHTLLELAEQCSTSLVAPQFVGLLGLFPPRWTLEDRIAGLLDPVRSQVTQPRWRAVVFVATILGAVSWLTGGVRTSNATAADKDNLVLGLLEKTSEVSKDFGSLRSNGPNTENLLALADIKSQGGSKGVKKSEPTWTFQVVDESGASVPAVKWTAEGWRESLTGTSDADGLCRISGLHHGVVVATDEQGRMGFATALQQRLTKTERIVMKKPRKVTVRVADQNGRPVAEADINVISSAGPFAFGQSGLDGTVTFKIPADAPVEWIAGKKNDVGFDYFENYDSFPSSDFGELPAEVTLTLDGARTVEARVVDTAGQPVEGVLVYPWTIHKRGKLSYVNCLTRLFRETSDVEGRISFEGMPADFQHAITLLPNRDGFHCPNPTWARATEPKKTLTLTMTRNARLSGRVLGANQQPLAGVKVLVSGRGDTNRYCSEETTTDDRGRYFVSVAAGQAYLIAIEHPDFAAPSHVTPLLKEREERNELNFTTSAGTLLRGRATVGKTPRPAKVQTVTLIQQAGHVPEAKKLYGTTSINLFRSVETDDDGRYSFRIGPGEYKLQLPHQPFEQRESLTIKDQREIVRDSHAEHPERGVLSGRVTLPNGQPAEKAIVYGNGIPQSGGAGFRCRTDRNGQYKTERWFETTLLMATSADGGWTGVGKATRDDETVDIALTPTAKITGSVLDVQMKPISRQRVTALVGPQFRVINLEAVTDETGHFEIPLAVGFAYNVHSWPAEKSVTIGQGEATEAKTYELPPFVLATNSDSKTSASADGKSSSPQRGEVKLSNVPLKQTEIREVAGPVTFDCRVIEKQSGKPLSGATVVVKRKLLRDALNPEKVIATTKHTTDEQGRYSVTFTAEEVAMKRLYVEIDASHPDCASWGGRGYSLAMILKNHAVGDPPFFAEVRLLKGRAISGQLLLPDGSPAKQTRLLAYAASKKALNAHEDSSFVSGRTDGEGRFRVMIPEPGRAMFWFYPASAAVLAQPVLEEQSDLGVLKLTVGSKLSGVVKNLRGEPIPNVVVVAHSQDDGTNKVIDGVAEGTERRSLTDSNGRYSLAPLPSGKYQVSLQEVYRDDRDDADESWQLKPIPGVFLNENVTLENDQPQEVNLNEAESVTITAHYFDSQGQPSSGWDAHVWGERPAVAQKSPLTDAFAKLFGAQANSRNDYWFGNALIEREGQHKGRILIRVPKGLTKAKFETYANEHGSLRIQRDADSPPQIGGTLKLDSVDADLPSIRITRYSAPLLLVRVTAKDNANVKDPKVEFRYVSDATAHIGQEKQSDGRIRSTQLIPDEPFAVSISADGFHPRTETLQLKEGTTQELEVVLEKR